MYGSGALLNKIVGQEQQKQEDAIGHPGLENEVLSEKQVEESLFSCSGDWYWNFVGTFATSGRWKWPPQNQRVEPIEKSRVVIKQCSTSKN